MRFLVGLILILALLPCALVGFLLALAVCGYTSGWHLAKVFTGWLLRQGPRRY